MARVEAKRHLPLVVRARDILAVSENSSEHIVSVGVIRMPLEPAQCGPLGVTRSLGAAQRVGERDPHHAVWIARHLVAQPRDVVRHRPLPVPR